MRTMYEIIIWGKKCYTPEFSGGKKNDLWISEMVIECYKIACHHKYGGNVEGGIKLNSISIFSWNV